MQSSDQPKKIATAFAAGGIRREIPNDSQIGKVDGAASYADGFPPKTFLPLEVGGVPPSGADFNGILNAVTGIQRWQSAGGLFKYDVDFAGAIGGYPKGAVLASANGLFNWENQTEGNITDPDSASASGWISVTPAAAKQFGAVGDGQADDTSTMLTTGKFGGYAREYKVTAFNNPYGYDVTPDGVAHNRSSGRVYNPRQQATEYYFGQEVLQHWFAVFASGAKINNGDTTVRTVVMSGDSTTKGVGATYGTPTFLISDLARQRGYSNVNVIDRGQSGKACFDWVSTYLVGDLAANPDLLVLRWGANDPFFGRTVDQFIADLRQGLSTIRSQKDVSKLSILLMTPTSMNDVEMGRTQVWSERIGPAIRQAARDFQCAFIDTYAMFQNSHDATGIWMDKDTSHYPQGRAIHPFDVLYEHVCGKIADMIYPDWGNDWRTNLFRNKGSALASDIRAGSELPGEYYAGIEMSRMGVSSGSPLGAPYNGAGLTFKSPDGIALQFSIPLADSVSGSGMSMRFGFRGTWTKWYGETVIGEGNLSNGWSSFGGEFAPFTYQLSLNGRCHIDGILKAGTTADGTTLFTLPTGYHPEKTTILLISSENGVCRLQINKDGVARIYNFGTTGGTYISLSGVSFKCGNN